MRGFFNTLHGHLIRYMQSSNSAVRSYLYKDNNCSGAELLDCIILRGVSIVLPTLFTIMRGEEYWKHMARSSDFVESPPVGWQPHRDYKTPGSECSQPRNCAPIASLKITSLRFRGAGRWIFFTGSRLQLHIYW